VVANGDVANSPAPRAPIELVMDWYVPTWVDNPINRCVNQFVVDHPDILVRPFSSLKLPGGLGGGDTTKLMAFAGGIAPDLVQCWFHKLQAFKDQGFLLPLTEYIGEDRNGDGYISDDEAKWAGWKDIPPSVRRACTVDGKPYGVPFGISLVYMLYRRDLVREITGSEEPPRTWDQFFYICQRLTQSPTRQPDGTLRKGRAGFYADTYAFRWLPWLWSAGGEEVRQGFTSPTDRKTYWFAKEVYAPKSPAGEDLSWVKPVWRCSFASAEGVAALDFYHRLFWQPWIRDDNGEPVNLTDADLQAGRVTTKDGKTTSFRLTDVIRGVSRGLLGDDKEAADELFKKGEICFYLGGNIDGLLTALSPSQIGFMSMPSPDGSRMTALQQPMWFCLNSALAKAPKEKRDAAWQLMESFTGNNFEKTALQVQIEKGTLKFADPDLLRKFDMAEHLADVPVHWQKEIQEMKRNTHTVRRFLAGRVRSAHRPANPESSHRRPEVRLQDGDQTGRERGEQQGAPRSQRRGDGKGPALGVGDLPARGGDMKPNSKVGIRNPKHIRMEQIQNPEMPAAGFALVPRGFRSFGNSNFVFVSDFGFRISDFS
jgi:ABC-type glycerol-3-phosphate transport system substrate-binding protein